MKYNLAYSISDHEEIDVESLDFLDEDSINQQAYLERLERDLEMGLPRQTRNVVEPLILE